MRACSCLSKPRRCVGRPFTSSRCGAAVDTVRSPKVTRTPSKNCPTPLPPLPLPVAVAGRCSSTVMLCRKGRSASQVWGSGTRSMGRRTRWATVQCSNDARVRFAARKLAARTPATHSHSHAAAVHMRSDELCKGAPLVETYSHGCCSHAARGASDGRVHCYRENRHCRRIPP
jgi:hypothetical protein